MHIQILGTAAAEGIPGIFCGCKTCARARQSGGKDLRSRASVQIDGVYKIDLPPDTYMHVAKYNLDLSALKYLFYTHSHGDHFTADEIEYTREGFSHNLKFAPIKVYGNSKVIRAIQTRSDRRELPLELHVAEPYIPINADYLTFTPIPANHAPNEQALNYIFQSNNATVLYASDTGFYEKDTIRHLINYKFDLLIVECTIGKRWLPSKHHMTFRSVLQLKKILARFGALKDTTRIVLTHFSHNIGMLQAELEQMASPHGIEIAYDGMEIDI